MLEDIKNMLDQLSQKERDVLILRFGLNNDGNKKTLDEKEILLNNSSKIRGLVNYNKLNYILTENSLNISNSKSNIRDVATLPNIKKPEKITSLSESLQYQFNNFSNEEFVALLGDMTNDSNLLVYPEVRKNLLTLPKKSPPANLCLRFSFIRPGAVIHPDYTESDYT